MGLILGIRREDKNEWERRVPIVPQDVKKLKSSYGVETVIQPSKIRAYTEDDYKLSGAKISENLSECPVIFAVKEIPLSFFEKEKTYVFFSHVIKGQSYNMPMLKKMMELGCNLIDYEKVTDEKNQRLIFFGKYAGLAGMIDTLWAFGQKLLYEGFDTPFKKIKKAIDYRDLDEAKKEISAVGEEIRIYGFDERLLPLTCGFTGYGNVSGGAREIFDLIPHEEIAPAELLNLSERPNLSRNIFYKVIFKEEHMVTPKYERDTFNLQDYFDNPEKYESQFDHYIDNLSIIVNCIYWDPRCPKFVTKNYLEKLFNKDQRLKLKTIGDITCDIEGSVECTSKITDSGDPVFVYNPQTRKDTMGFKGPGVVVLAVDNLPCELPIDSSRDFSRALMPFVPGILKADYTKDFKSLKLPTEVKKALIMHKGKLTPDYEYILKYL